MGSISTPQDPTKTALCGIVTPVGMLGYGYDDSELQRGLELCLSQGLATAIILDSGSTDSGPQKLALGSMTMPRAAYLRDMGKLVRAVMDHHVPLIIGSAGGDGSDAHVQVIVDCVREVLDEMEE